LDVMVWRERGGKLLKLERIQARYELQAVQKGNPFQTKSVGGQSYLQYQGNEVGENGNRFSPI